MPDSTGGRFWFLKQLHNLECHPIMSDRYFSPYIQGNSAHFLLKIAKHLPKICRFSMIFMDVHGCFGLQSRPTPKNEGVELELLPKLLDLWVI